MSYIIFDMEFTVLRKNQYMADILEIGAIKLIDEGGHLSMIDLFHTYVRPNNYKTITNQTTDFTGITQEQVNSAPTFKEVVSNFKCWLGDSPYYMCAWGPDDKQQLVRHCALHKVELEWIQNYNDIQLMFTRLQGGDHGQRYGLKKALTATEIEFLGSQHNALDDAFNTAKLFKMIFPQLSLEENNAANELRYSTSVVYSTGDEMSKPFCQLAELLGMAI
ncbi:3'-5' exonuclease [Paenibacillus sp. V4I5]|uniref:3'-5' exonuclease n=1 Tax=Paenibacillus sp. V4I5 TaxID=3042306 RepID=UPI0027929A91|nr:3'-5' exonuclease [Paenibacillus sp. V4I5]MDQ0917574.1 inhibitor of KinA sporulation pathway (predicted exonuclease) [Paenibacillus sp. V4I5]